MTKKKEKYVASMIRVKKLLKIGREDIYESETEEEMDVRAFEVEPAKVSVGKGLTVNLGDYSSARVDVHVEIPCYLEQVQDVYEALNSMVSRCVRDEAIELKKFRDGKKKGA